MNTPSGSISRPECPAVWPGRWISVIVTPPRSICCPSTNPVASGRGDVRELVDAGPRGTARRRRAPCRRSPSARRANARRSGRAGGQRPTRRETGARQPHGLRGHGSARQRSTGAGAPPRCTTDVDGSMIAVASVPCTSTELPAGYSPPSMPIRTVVCGPSRRSVGSGAETAGGMAASLADRVRDATVRLGLRDRASGSIDIGRAVMRRSRTGVGWHGCCRRAA